MNDYIFVSLGLLTGLRCPFPPCWIPPNNQLLVWVCLWCLETRGALPSARRLGDFLSSGLPFDWGGPHTKNAGAIRRRGRRNRGPTAARDRLLPPSVCSWNCICCRALVLTGDALLALDSPLSPAFGGLLRHTRGRAGRRDAGLALNAGRAHRLCHRLFRPPRGTKMGIFGNGGPLGETRRDSATDG